MDEKIFQVELSRAEVPDDRTYAELSLPASPWEMWDALERVRLQKDENLCVELIGYERFEELMPHLYDLDVSLNELNDFASQLSALNEAQEITFKGLLAMETQRKADTDGGIIEMQDLRDLAASAAQDCCHVVDAADDEQLGRFYAANDFIPELDGISDDVFGMLDFARIGAMMRRAEGGVFVGGCYVVQADKMVSAPPCETKLPKKPEYLFRLTLGLHPDSGNDRTVTLDLPTTDQALLDAQKQLDAEGFAGAMVVDYDGIVPDVMNFADLPEELMEFNRFAKAVRDADKRLQDPMPTLKALLQYFEVRDLQTAISLAEHLEDYILNDEISSPKEAAIADIWMIAGEQAAASLLPYVNLFAYGEEVIRQKEASLTPYGLLESAAYSPLRLPSQKIEEQEEMTMR